MALVPSRPDFGRRADGAPTYARGRRWPAWALLAVPFAFLMAVLLPVVRRRVHWMACLLTVVLFEAVMLPVEHWAILQGFWVYNENRILGPLLWGIPIEEPFIYYLLPPILVIMIFEYLSGRASGALSAPPPASYWMGRRARPQATRRRPLNPRRLRPRRRPPARTRPGSAALGLLLCAGLLAGCGRPSEPVGGADAAAPRPDETVAAPADAGSEDAAGSAVTADHPGPAPAPAGSGAATRTASAPGIPDAAPAPVAAGKAPGGGAGSGTPESSVAASTADPTDPIPPPPAAILIEAEGEVTVRRGATGTEVDGEDDLPLQAGDQVRTGAGAKAVVSFRDEHLVRLAETTELVIRELRSGETGFFGRVRLVTGRLFASFARMTGEDSGFQVETGSAVAAVKGTTFSVDAGQDATTISVLDGTVAASGLDDQGRAQGEVVVPAGQETDVPVRDRRPGRLRSFERDARRAALREHLGELRGRAGRWRAMARTGEVARGRRMRNLARASHLLDLERTDPDALAALPEDRRAELRRFIARHRGEVGRRGPELRRFLKANPGTQERLKAQAERRVRHRRNRGGRNAETPSGLPGGAAVPDDARGRPAPRENRRIDRPADRRPDRPNQPKPARKPRDR